MYQKWPSQPSILSRVYAGHLYYLFLDISPIYVSNIFCKLEIKKPYMNWKKACLMFIDALDACLMVHGSWLKAHGSWPREARGGSWLMARGRPGFGDPEARFRSGPGPARFWVPRAGPAPGHEPRASPGLPWP